MAKSVTHLLLTRYFDIILVEGWYGVCDTYFDVFCCFYCTVYLNLESYIYIYNFNLKRNLKWTCTASLFWRVNVLWRHLDRKYSDYDVICSKQKEKNIQVIQFLKCKSVPERCNKGWRYRWCDKGACHCSYQGCKNHALYDKYIIVTEWEK